MVDGVARFAASLGGLPDVTEILFFAQDYDLGSADHRLTPRPDVGASFSAGSLLVFRKGTRGRFVAAGRRDPGTPSNTTREGVGYEMTQLVKSVAPFLASQPRMRGTAIRYQAAPELPQPDPPAGAS